MGATKVLRLARTLPRLGAVNAAVVAGYREFARRGWLGPSDAGDLQEPLFTESARPTLGMPNWRASHVFDADIAALKDAPAWLFNPLGGASTDAKGSWWEAEHFSVALGDIKGVWEASRFGWAPVLALRGEVAKLNAWTADWTRHNPCYRGVNWACGQEASLRLLHILLTSRILDQDQAPPPGLTRFVDAHLRRISATVWYAMAQDNNHGTSEAVALFAGGAWLAVHGELPQRRRGERWARSGRRWLENRAQRLIFPDGGFSQYSVNYHRLMLDTLAQAELWRRRLDARPFSSAFYRRAAAASNWLGALVNAENGDAPNLGANDGARAFRVDALDYRDHRTCLQTAANLFLQRSALRPGPWDAMLQVWGVDLAPMDGSILSKNSRYFASFGLAVLSAPDAVSYAFIRVPTRRFRPPQADPLHFDLWTAGGRNLLRDGGSFSYADETANAFFTGVAAHNSIAFDGADPMPRISRFLFSDWIQGVGSEPSRGGDGEFSWSGAYRTASGARHRRTVETSSGKAWRVRDDIGGFQREAVLRWRLEPGAWSLSGASVEGAFRLTVEGNGALDVRLVETWESPIYGERIPSPCLEVRSGPGVSRLTTLIELS